LSARWTAALLGVALALGAWVYFGEIGGEARKKDAETAAQRVFTLDPNSVTAIEVTTADGKSAHLAKSGTEWKLDAPVSYPADPDAVERLLRALSKVQSTASMPAPGDLGQFGLGDGRRSLKLWSGPGDPKEVFVGGPTPVGVGKYFQLASDPAKIYTVSAADLSGVTPTLVELRDKRLLRASSSNVDELTVHADGALVAHLKKGDTGWQMLEPEKVPGDEEKIRRAPAALPMRPTRRKRARSPSPSSSWWRTRPRATSTSRSRKPTARPGCAARAIRCCSRSTRRSRRGSRPIRSTTG